MIANGLCPKLSTRHFQAPQDPFEMTSEVALL